MWRCGDTEREPQHPALFLCPIGAISGARYLRYASGGGLTAGRRQSEQGAGAFPERFEAGVLGLAA